MNIKLEELQAIEKALRLLPKGNCFSVLPEEVQKTIMKADLALFNCYKRNKKPPLKWGGFLLLLLHPPQHTPQGPQKAATGVLRS